MNAYTRFHADISIRKWHDSKCMARNTVHDGSFRSTWTQLIAHQAMLAEKNPQDINQNLYGVQLSLFYATKAYTLYIQ